MGHREVRIQARRFRERAAGLGMIEAIGQVQALVHEQLGLLGLGRDREDVIADFLQSRRAGAGSGGGVERIGGLIVLVDRDLGVQREAARPSASAARHKGRWRIEDSPWGWK